MEKYIANRAAKNISSLESHTMVPTLTMLGLVSEWIWLRGMAGAAVTRSLLPPIRSATRRGPWIRACHHPADIEHRAGHSLGNVQFAGGFLAHGGDHDLPPLRAGTLFHLDIDPWLVVWLVVIAALYLSAVWRMRRRGDRWPVARTLSFVVLGLGGIASVTMTGVSTYDDTLL